MDSILIFETWIAVDYLESFEYCSIEVRVPIFDGEAPLAAVCRWLDMSADSVLTGVLLWAQFL